VQAGAGPPATRSVDGHAQPVEFRMRASSFPLLVKPDRPVEGSGEVGWTKTLKKGLPARFQAGTPGFRLLAIFSGCTLRENSRRDPGPEDRPFGTAMRR